MMEETRSIQGGKVYHTTKICDRTKITMEEGSVIGDFCFICCAELVMLEGAQLNRYVSVTGRGRVVVGRNATVSNYVSLKTSTDTPYGKMNDQVPEEYRRVKTGEIIIGDNAFIGEYASINPTVAIGDGAVVGSYSYVSQDVPPWLITHPPKERSISVFRLLADGIPMKNYPEEQMRQAEEEIRRRAR
jgi:acetyltransferase-like isoleucine patch superfamily enzyme